MDKLFNMDNKFFSFMGRAADLFMLNVVFVICCLPVVTIGASLTALHYVTLKMARNEESYIIRSFFKSFKQNFKQSTIINLIMLLIAGVLYFDTNIVRQMGGSMSKVLYIIFIALGIIYLAVFLYIYPVLAKFYNSIKNTFRSFFDVHHASALYHPYGSDHHCTCRHFLYSGLPGTVRGHSAFYIGGLCPACFYQRAFPGKDFR